ncbi:hypothetical protein [Pararhizobium sp. IMCC21322]|nr:hypothetical protein [Pararhizobium sp. IMCC21322]
MSSFSSIGQNPFTGGIKEQRVLQLQINFSARFERRYGIGLDLSIRR